MHFVQSKSILSSSGGMNIYRGCQHGCIYCDSRSECYNMNHEFTDIEVKENAPELLEEALRRKRNKCMIGTGSMCDPFMPTEQELRLTHKCIEIVEKYGFGFTAITKSDKVLDELELLKKINENSKCVIQMTLTTADEKLCGILEPEVCATKRRYEILKKFQEENIPTIVWFTPILPFINDTEENLTKILKMCADAKVKGIIYFGAGLTLRKGNREYFYKKLDEHFPKMKEKYIKEFGNSYICASPADKRLTALFHEFCDGQGIMHNNDEIFSYLRKFEEKENIEQMAFF